MNDVLEKKFIIKRQILYKMNFIDHLIIFFLLLMIFLFLSYLGQKFGNIQCEIIDQCFLTFFDTRHPSFDK